MKNVSGLSVLFLGLCVAAQGGAQTGATPPAKAAAEPAGHALIWTDPATGLMWAGSDNASDVNWNQAKEYCSKLRLAGDSDWRLPTIDELKAIDDPDGHAAAFYQFGVYSSHIKGNLYLTGWIWSSSPGDATRNGPWHFNFQDEKAADAFPVGFSFKMRALCVRSGR